MAILKEMKEEFLKRFKQSYNLGRYGKLEPKKDEMKFDHQELAESVFNASCITLNEAGVMYPTFFLIKEDKFMPVVLSPESFQEMGLEGYSSAVINIADEQNADAVMFISEQWMVKRQIDDSELKDFREGKKIPSLDPDRQEMLCLFYMTKDGVVKTLVGEISRTIENKPFVRDSKWTKMQAETSFLSTWGHNQD